MNRSQLAQASALFWRHLRPALTNPAKFAGLVQRIGQIWASKGFTGAIKHHAPGTALYRDYPKWLVEREPLQIMEGANNKIGPTISILAISDASSDAEFPQMLESLLTQNDHAWELVVDSHLWQRYTNPKDPRVKTVETAEIQASSEDNAFGKLLQKLAQHATAPYVHIYQSGQFRRDWIRQCAAAITDTEPILLYWDHDLLDAQQQRHTPNFKPRLNPELALSQNYIGAAWITPRQLFLAANPIASSRANMLLGEARKIGSFGAFCYYLQLEIIFTKRSKNIHIAQVLSHHRSEVTLSSLTDALNSFLCTHDVSYDHATFNGTAFQLKSANKATPKVSIIIPTRDGLGLLKHTISTLQALTTYPNYEIIIADNDSTDPATCAYLNDVNGRNKIRVFRAPGAFNFSKINNLATEHTDGELLLFLNNDVEIIESNWLSEMVGNALNTGVGAVGCMLLFPNRTIQHAGIVLGLGGYAKHVFANQPEGYAGPNGRACSLQQMSAVTAACLMVQRVHFNAVNGFDERYAVAFNDVDLCLRLQAAGLRNIWTPNAILLHHESASRGYDDSVASQARFLVEAQQFHARWDHELRDDPFYNPNLTLTDAAFALGWERTGNINTKSHVNHPA
jgi:O-antigen biosynthesis protein